MQYKKHNILIVEDDESMMNFLEISLKREGYNINSENNGTEALESLRNNNFDLLLTDIVMSGMDGFELAKKAKKHNPNIKVMFITGFSAMATKQQASDIESDSKLLSKPFHLNELIEQIKQLLGS